MIKKIMAGFFVTGEEYIRSGQLNEAAGKVIFQKI